MFNPCGIFCSEFVVSFYMHFLDELFLLSVISQLTWNLRYEKIKLWTRSLSKKKRKILIFCRKYWLSKWLFFAESAQPSHGLIKVRSELAILDKNRQNFDEIFRFSLRTLSIIWRINSRSIWRIRRSESRRSWNMLPFSPPLWKFYPIVSFVSVTRLLLVSKFLTVNSGSAHRSVYRLRYVFLMREVYCSYIGFGPWKFYLKKLFQFWWKL